jgi:hypothetical protein
MSNLSLTTINSYNMPQQKANSEHQANNKPLSMALGVAGTYALFSGAFKAWHGADILNAEQLERVADETYTRHEVKCGFS